MISQKKLSAVFAFVVLLLLSAPELFAHPIGHTTDSDKPLKTFVRPDTQTIAPSATLDREVSAPSLNVSRTSILTFDEYEGSLCIWCLCTTSNHGAICQGIGYDCHLHAYVHCRW